MAELLYKRYRSLHLQGMARGYFIAGHFLDR